MAKCVIVAHHAPFMRRLLMSALKELGYEPVEQHPPEPDAQWQHDHPGMAMPMRWEDTVRLYRQHQAAAVIVDPIDGPALAQKLLRYHPDMVAIGCGQELDPASQKTGSLSPAARQKALLDAGVKATAVLKLTRPAPLLKEALDKALS